MNKYLLGFYLVVAVHLIIISKLIFFPYPEFFVYPYLTNQGLLPYSQIFDQHFPGLMFLPINLDNLGMTNEVIARRWLMGIVAVSQVLIYYISYKIFNSHSKALLASVLYLMWQPFLEGWVLWIDNFLPLFLLPAFYFTYQAIKTKGDKFDLTAAGFFISLAILFKQVSLPLAGAIFLLFLFMRTKNWWFYILGNIPVILLTFIYYLNLGVIKDMFFWTITFNLTTFAQFGGKPPFISGVIRLFGIYSPVLLSPLIKDKELLIILLIFFLGSFSGDLARFDFVHFQPSLPFAILLTVAVINNIPKGIFFKILVLGYLLMSVIWLGKFYNGHLSNQIFFFDPQTRQVAQRITELSEPQEEIYLFGPVTHLYQMSQTIPAGRIFVFQFPWFLMETEDRFLEALKTTQPKLVVRDKTVVIEGIPINQFASKIDKYIEENYQVTEKIGQVEFMKRR